MGSTSLWKVTSGAAAKLDAIVNTIHLIDIGTPLVSAPKSRTGVAARAATPVKAEPRINPGLPVVHAGIRRLLFRTHQIHGTHVQRNRHVEEPEHHLVPALFA